ncbi:MAG: methyltransferase domain-containing protein [Treponema sp.]|nr:methyltransferase domain-containing protein [Candidatus Treponema merdequi]
METITNLVEYYDELYPVTQEQFDFYNSILETFSKPVRFLNVGCGTGILENRLAKDMTDVTGLETIKELLESAARKRRNQLMAVRFFQMSTIEMVRFLGKGFYNVISCLNDRIIFIHDKVLLRKFFFDCKQLLVENGIIVLQLSNYNLFKKNQPVNLPKKNSIRVSLSSKIEPADDGEYFLTSDIETGNGKKLPVYDRVKVYPVVQSEIADFAKEAGFNSVEFYSDYKKTPASESSESLVVIIR